MPPYLCYNRTMKLSHLRQITDYMRQFTKIDAIYRVGDTRIKIVFDKKNTLYFEMNKNDPYIFTSDDIIRQKYYQAPFDIALAKLFNRAKITKIALHNDDKLLRIYASQQGAYKRSDAVIQFEFTGRYANVIILDENDTVIEALRHIDAEQSYRIVKVGQRLEALPPRSYDERPYNIDDIETFLNDAYAQREAQKLVSFKKQKRTQLQKKLAKIEREIAKLPDERELEKSAAHTRELAQIILSNLHRIKPYEKELSLIDFEGKSFKLPLKKSYAEARLIADDYFKAAKKLKKRAKSLHIERETLEEKRDFYRRFIHIVENERSLAKLQNFFTAQKDAKRQKKEEGIETLFFEGYKIMLGKSKRGNIALLKKARARDLWFHLKDIPSAHLIVVTNKQNIPQNVIEFAAKLVVDFSVFEKGSYLVDYTPRREVKVQEEANVLYYNYKTICVTKE